MSDIRFNQWLHNSGTGGISQDSAGHVGIGTTVPTHINALTNNNSILHVGIVSCNTLNAASKIEGSIDDWIIHQSDTNTKFGFPDADQFQVQTGGSSRLTVTNANVTATGLLTVDGGSAAKPTFKHSAGWGALRVAGSAGGSGSGFILANNYSGTIEEKWSIYLDGSNDGLRFTAGPPETTSSEKVRITAAGKVGIGTVAPDETLELWKASGTNLVKISTQANSTIGLLLEKTGSTTQSWKIADGQTANGTLEIYDATESETRLAIDGSGRVIIGQHNHSGGGTLVVCGNANTPNAYGCAAFAKIGANPTSGTTLAQLRFSAGSGGTNRAAEISVQADSNWNDGTNQESKMIFKVASSGGGNTAGNALMTLKGTGDVELNRGNLVVINGKGIDFSAQTTTSAAGGAASTGADEILDHYEKGDWDPTIYGHLGGGSFGINSRYGRYIRIGHLVSAWGYINWASTGGNGVVNIAGLPFTPNNISANNSAVVIGSRIGWSYPRIVGQMYHTGYINVQYIDASSPYNSFNVSVGALQSTGSIRFRLQYEVA